MFLAELPIIGNSIYDAVSFQFIRRCLNTLLRVAGMIGKVDPAKPRKSEGGSGLHAISL